MSYVFKLKTEHLQDPRQMSKHFGKHLLYSGYSGS